MTTYNGESYVVEQLESIREQSMLPDELVIIDDGSSDATLRLIEEFAANAPFDVQVYCNKRNLGITRNFEKSLSLTKGDVVFLCDQDDYWLPNKISTILAAQNESMGINVFINDALYADSALTPDKTSVLEKAEAFTGTADSHIAGCCTAMSRAFLEFILPFPKGNCPQHDVYIHRWANLIETRVVIPEVLQYWRIHDEGHSVSELKEPGLISNFNIGRKYFSIDAAEAYLAKAEEFSEMGELLDERKEAFLRLSTEPQRLRIKQEIESIVSAHRLRASLSSSGWLANKRTVLRLLRNGDYKYFLGIRSFIKDLFR